MKTNVCNKTENTHLSTRFCRNASSFASSLNFRFKAELTARILRTNITKLDILESDMIMRTVAAGLLDTF